MAPIPQSPPPYEVKLTGISRAQADLITAMLSEDAGRVRVGTVHTFQGGNATR